MLIQNWKVPRGKEKTKSYHEYSTEYWDVIDDMSYWNPSIKKIINKEEHIKQQYNVYVYRTLCYPPPIHRKIGLLYE